MKRTLEISSNNKKYTFVFYWFLLPFFRCYFGESIKSNTLTKEDDVTINYRVMLSGKKEKLEQIIPGKISIYIPILKVFRAIIRSAYQIIFPKSKSIGLFEYFVYLIRISFLEPLEEELANKGFFLIHSAVATKNNKDALVFIAASKGGKSTVARIIEKLGYRVASDNYAFFDGKNVITIPECRRHSYAKRFSFSFYGKDVIEATTQGAFKIEKLYWLSFNREFSIKSTLPDQLAHKLYKLYLNEKEGFFTTKNSKVESNFESIKHNLMELNYFEVKMIKNMNKTKKFLKGLIND